MSCAKPQKPLPKPAEARRWFTRWLIAGYRLGLLAAAFFCLFVVTERRSKDAGDRLDSSAALPLVIRHLPQATSISEPEGEDRVSAVLNGSSEIIGWVAQTRPDSDAITGYAGASNLLVLMDAYRRVIGVEILTSADTSGHVSKVREDVGFMSQWNGRHQASLGHPDKPTIVSGASLTSEAMARGIAARFGAKGMDEWFPEEVVLSEVKRWFPEAASVDGTKVLSPEGKMLGTLLRSSRMGIAARGFQGASDVLLALDAEGKTILGAAMRGSRDNEPYISDARDAVMYDKPYEGKTPQSLIAAEAGTTVMVSGASRTAESVEETVKEMLRRHLAPTQKAEAQFGVQEGVALLWIVAGLWLGLGSMRGKKRVRTGFAVLTVLFGGLWLGLMLGQDQWIKWSMRGSISGSMLPLMALTAAALLIPAAFGKNIYCSQLCAHGAAQQLLGNLRKRRFALPPKLHRVMVMMPWLTLFVLWTLAFAGMSVPFADAEPFEVWSVGFIALLPVLIFAAGLIAAVFLPQAYCHYGCPTGAVLKFLASSPGRWTKRDAIASGLVGIAWLSLLIP